MKIFVNSFNVRRFGWRFIQKRKCDETQIGLNLDKLIEKWEKKNTKEKYQKTLNRKEKNIDKRNRIGIGKEIEIAEKWKKLVPIWLELSAKQDID